MTRAEALNLMDKLQQLAGPLSCSPARQEVAEYVAKELFAIADELFENHIKERKESYSRVSMVA